ncbi:MAG: hypothetical protein SO176_02685 [Bacilli bacterium]|nr:hypothetical protein [Bacilli bacterium]
MEEALDKQLKVGSNHAKCEHCGGNLIFDPTSQALFCPHCESKFEFDKNNNQIKHAINEGKIDVKEERDEWAKDMKVVRCQNCGAEILITGLDIASNCPYCGSNYVVDSTSLPGLKPDVVVPFLISKSKASEVFLKGIKKKFFAPSALKKQLPESKIRGIYIPTFTFDSKTESLYRGVLTKTVTHTNAKGQTYTTQKSFPISGNEKLLHNDFVVESSSKMNGKQMNALLPYDFSKTYAYDPNFIRGFAIEHYVDELSICYDCAKKAIDERIKKSILSHYDYTYVNSLTINTKYFDELYSYRMLPIYSFEFSYKKKQFLVFMNGQTGKVGTGYPKSPLKITLVVLGIIILVSLLIFLLIQGS